MNSVDFYDEDQFFILTGQVHNGFVLMTEDLFAIAEYWLENTGRCGYLTEMYGQEVGYIRV